MPSQFYNDYQIDSPGHHTPASRGNAKQPEDLWAHVSRELNTAVHVPYFENSYGGAGPFFLNTVEAVRIMYEQLFIFTS